MFIFSSTGRLGLHRWGCKDTTIEQNKWFWDRTLDKTKFDLPGHVHVLAAWSVGCRSVETNAQNHRVKHSLALPKNLNCPRGLKHLNSGLNCHGTSSA
eukprot:5398499-Amphidinium_carterae.2